MILSEINEGVTRVIKVSADPDIYGQKQSEPGSALSVCAFYKGERVPDWVLARVIDAANRGYITPAGKELLLIPIKTLRHATKVSVANVRDQARKNKKRIPKNPAPAPSIKKSDCFSLSSYLPPTGPTKPENDLQRPRRLRAVDTKTRYATRVPKGTVNSTLKRCNGEYDSNKRDAK